MPPSKDYEVNTRRLRSLLSQVQGGVIQVPEFQRAVRLDETWIANLVASVSLGYPVGALTLLQSNSPDFRFPSRPVPGAPAAGGLPQWFLVDGQHRVAALHRALFADKAERRMLYVDLEKWLEPGADRSDALLWAEAAEADALLPLRHVFAEQPPQRRGRSPEGGPDRLDEASERAIAAFERYRIPVISLPSSWTEWTIRMRAGVNGRELVEKYRVNAGSR